MSADILEYVDQKVRDSASSSTEWSILYADDWAKLRAEIVRLRGEVEFHQLDAGALRVQLDSCIERLEVQTKNALHLHAMMVDAEARAATIAPAEAKGDAETLADNAKAADRACFLAIANGYAWDGAAWVKPPTPQPADGGSVAVMYQQIHLHHGADARWEECDKATFDKYTRYHQKYGGEAPVRALGVIGTNPPAAQVQPNYTTGHCKNKQQPGGCHLHNLHCAFPECDRRKVDATRPAVDALGAVRDAITETVLKYADNDNIPPGLFRDEMFAAVTAALQHRGDSRGGEG